MPAPHTRQHASHRRNSRRLMTLGWREWVSLPQLGGVRIKAKLDTGARTSCLHAEELNFYARGDSRFAAFTIYPLQRSRLEKIRTRARVVELREVTSSTGHRTSRPVIETDIRIGGSTYPIEVTLINRDVMGFRMLLGRQALRERILVNAGRSFLSLPKR